LISVVASPAAAQLQVGDICRVKGQEGNTLHGMGVVVGLKGTGDGSYSPTTRALVQVMHNLGIPMSAGADGRLLLDELKDGRNTALVFVTAEIPAHGGRQGDEYDCMVSAAHAKSLEGGTLFMTPLLGPPRRGERPEEARIYAFAHGSLRLDDKNNSTTARIARGCRLEQSVHNPFVKNNKITLVLNRSHARFAVAEEVAFAVNSQKEFQEVRSTSRRGLAKAVDQLSVEVTIPEKYRDDLVAFVSLVLEQRLLNVPREAVVVVNETTGVIAMSADLEIAPTAITHANMAIDAKNGIGVSPFVGIDPKALDTAAPTLNALVQSMNALRVSTRDMIQIIRELDEMGHIYGHVIYSK
jgi:flagellar P-ring protein FlgI